MRRMLKIVNRSLKISFMMDMEYKADFFAMVFQGIVFIFFNLTFYKVIVEKIGGIGDWSYMEMVLLFGVYTIADGIFMAFIVSNVNGIGRLVNTGALDMYLLKPIDSQLLLSARYANFGEIPSIFFGMFLCGYALMNLGRPVGIAEFIIFFVSICCSIIIFYCMALMLTCIAFFIERSDEIAEIIFSLKQFAKLPDVYTGAMRYFFMFITPIVFTSFVPAAALAGKLRLSFFVYYLVVTCVFMVVSRLFWKYCLTKYKSAGG